MSYINKSKYYPLNCASTIHQFSSISFLLPLIKSSQSSPVCLHVVQLEQPEQYNVTIQCYVTLSSPHLAQTLSGWPLRWNWGPCVWNETSPAAGVYQGVDFVSPEMILGCLNLDSTLLCPGSVNLATFNF